MNSETVFLTNHNTFYERSQAIRREINDPVNMVQLYAAKDRREIEAKLNQIIGSIDFIKNRISELPSEIIDLTNEFLKGLNYTFNYFIDEKNKGDVSIENFIRSLCDYSEKFTGIYLNAYCYFTLQKDKYKDDIEKLKNKSQDEFNEIKQMKENVEAQLSILKETVDKFKEENKSETENLELRANSLDFEKIAERYNDQSKHWRVWIIVLIAVLITISFWFLYWMNKIDLINVNGLISDENKSILFYFVLFKNAALRIFIIGILIYWLKFCIKNYNTAKHNWTINKHKANCLEAAIRIIALSPKEDKVRESILTLAGKEIFAQQKTGYLSKDANIDIGILEKIISTAGKTER